MARIDIVHIPFKGGAPALNELLAGRCRCTLRRCRPPGPHITAGKLMPLATTGWCARRSCPTCRPSPTPAGLHRDQLVRLHRVGTHAGTVLERWNQELVKALKAPEVAEELTRAGLLPAPGTRDELARYIERESKTWGKVIADRKITAE